MNSHIHKEDFPTRFDTASKVADIVRLFTPAGDRLPFFLLGFTSGGPSLHELHLWWLFTTWASPLVALISMDFTSGGPSPHELHLWWLSTTWASPLVAFFFTDFTSGGPFLLNLHIRWLVIKTGS